MKYDVTGMQLATTTVLSCRHAGAAIALPRRHVGGGGDGASRRMRGMQLVDPQACGRYIMADNNTHRLVGVFSALLQACRADIDVGACDGKL